MRTCKRPISKYLQNIALKKHVFRRASAKKLRGKKCGVKKKKLQINNEIRRERGGYNFLEIIRKI